MDRIKSWAGPIFAFATSAVMTAASVIFGKEFWDWVFWAGIAATVASGIWVVMVWQVKSEASQEFAMAGDNFTNNGNNFGHMGPVNNYGKPIFQLTDDLVRQVVAGCPAGKSVVVHAVGNPSKSFPMQAILVAALKAASFSVDTYSTMMLLPAPEHPLSLDVHGPQTVVTIAPDA